MATIYQCDITGEQYGQEDALNEVGVQGSFGRRVLIEYGPDAPVDKIKEVLHEEVEELLPHHDEWYDEQTGDYLPPQTVENTVEGVGVTVRIYTVERQPYNN